MNEASNIEKIIITNQWPSITDIHRRNVGLCPNCLAERIGPIAAPHASWCAIGRYVKKMETEAK